MATKKCAAEHCDVTFETKGAGKFCELHATVKLIKSKTSRKPFVIEEPEKFLVPVYVNEAQLDGVARRGHGQGRIRRRELDKRL